MPEVVERTIEQRAETRMFWVRTYACERCGREGEVYAERKETLLFNPFGDICTDCLFAESRRVRVA